MRFIYTSILFLFAFSSYSQCVTGDCENGYGKYKCDCGYVFEGDFSNGQKVKGTLTKKDLVYTGDFKNDLAEGYGVMKYKDGSWFEGTFKNNAPHGYGSYYFSNGQKFVGEVFEGSFKGMGIQVFSDIEGRVIETQFGIFADDRLNGMGCSISFNGDIYMGNFLNGNYMGFGVFVFAEQETAEAGRFRKMKLKDNVIMNDYPEKGFFGVKGYVLDSLQYNLSGDVYASNIQINVGDTSNNQTAIYFSLETKQFFISNLGDPSTGKMINEDGEVYTVKFDPLQKPYITILNQLYTKE